MLRWKYRLGGEHGYENRREIIGISRVAHERGFDADRVNALMQEAGYGDEHVSEDGRKTYGILRAGDGRGWDAMREIALM